MESSDHKPPIDNLPDGWNAWLERGWHSVRATDWFDAYMLPKLRTDMTFLDGLRGGPLDRAAQRVRRNAVEQLLRFQHMLPWDSAKRTQFFSEETKGDALLSDKEHALPISQLKSLILMAWEGYEATGGATASPAEAERRLLFAWLCPTVRCTKETHRVLSKGEKRRCVNFERPLSRYAGIPLRRFDGVEIDAATYSLNDMIDDLSRVTPLQPLIYRLGGLSLPKAEVEARYTTAMTDRR